MVFFKPHEVSNPLPVRQSVPSAGVPVYGLPDEVISHGMCGCQHPHPPTEVGQRPQVHISTGGVVAVVVGGVMVVVTVGVVLTSLLLAVAIVAGSLAVMAMSLAVVAMAIKSTARDTNTKSSKWRK